MEYAKKREDVVKFESLSPQRTQWLPFSATIHMAHGKSLSPIERTILGEALVNAAHRICEKRGLEPGGPFWIE